MTVKLLGVPYDAHSSFLRGPALAPSAIRSALTCERDSALQVVRNLLDNAERHATSSVIVSIDRDVERIELCVGNDGSPIAPEDRDRVFRPFLRLDEARSLEAGGSGLGLAIVRTIMASAGGWIQVDDQNGSTRFVATFLTND